MDRSRIYGVVFFCKNSNRLYYKGHMQREIISVVWYTAVVVVSHCYHSSWAEIFSIVFFFLTLEEKNEVLNLPFQWNQRRHFHSVTGSDLISTYAKPF